VVSSYLEEDKRFSLRRRGELDKEIGGCIQSNKCCIDCWDLKYPRNTMSIFMSVASVSVTSAVLIATVSVLRFNSCKVAKSHAVGLPYPISYSGRLEGLSAGFQFPARCCLTWCTYCRSLSPLVNSTPGVFATASIPNC